MRVTVIPIVIGELGTVLKCLESELEESRVDYSIVKIDLITKKSPGDLKRLVIT